jgi:ppGpp synthetase/RelA/SpoT-type nucleotidyltranferase
MDSVDIEDVRRKYEQLRPQYQQLVDEGCHILKEVFRETGFQPAAVSGRAKTTNSFVEKISRKGYEHPFQQMTDLAGIRVVCRYESELETIRKVIEDNFEVTDRVDKSKDLGVDRMGYNGKSFVIRLRSDYRGMACTRFC